MTPRPTLDARTVTLADLDAREAEAQAAFDALPLEDQSDRVYAQYDALAAWLWPNEEQLEDVVAPEWWFDEPMERLPVRDIGALTEWWRQLAAGERTTTTFDPLWYAACREAEARDLLRAECPHAADDARTDAANIILGAP